MRAWVDFNSVEDDRTATLRQYVCPEVGDRIVAVDGEGNTCDAVVLHVVGEVVDVHLDPDTFRRPA